MNEHLDSYKTDIYYFSTLSSLDHIRGMRIIVILPFKKNADSSGIEFLSFSRDEISPDGELPCH
jgi:hypothetical protein